MSLNPQVVEAAFDAALQLPPDRRWEFLEREYSSDEPLRARVLKLLDAHAAAQGFLEQPIAVNMAQDFGDDPAIHEGLGTDLRGAFGAMLDEAAAAQKPAPEAPPTDDHSLSDFRIIREVGRGGMGIVYEAEQISLGRRVALKVLPERFASSERRRERFYREARAAAKLHHTNIVPVHSVGAHGSIVFFSMQFILGTGLDRLIAELRKADRNRAHVPVASAAPNDHATPVELPKHTTILSEDRPVEAAAKPAITPAGFPRIAGDEQQRDTYTGRHSETGAFRALSEPGAAGRTSLAREVARIGVQVARGLDYAHHHGVLHRDIKPANLMMDAEGLVWITDFGLAKLDDAAELTESGDLLGTLRYMAPEMFGGSADARSDLYALGMTLYEILALKPAFDDSDRHRLIRRVLDEAPTRLRILCPEIPRDLETVIEKAIAREPQSRYQSAGEFADDLQRFLDDRPIRARRIGPVEHLVRWSRRQRVLSSLIAAVVAVFLIGFSAVWWQWGVAVAAQTEESRQKTAAIQAQIREQAERVKAQKEKLRAETARLEELKARQAAEKARDNEARQRELAETSTYTSRMALAKLAWDANDLGLVDDLLKVSEPGPGEKDRREWEWHYLKNLVRTESLSLSGHSGGGLATSVAYSSDGRFLATAGGGDLYFSNPGHTILPGEILLRRAGDGTVLHTLRGFQNIVFHVAFSRDGSRILGIDRPVHAGDTRNFIIVFDTQSGTEVCRVKTAANDHVTDARFAPDGTAIATVSKGDTAIRFWNTADGTAMRSIPLASAVGKLAFSPDGRRLATSGHVQSTGERGAVFDVATGKQLFELSGTSDAVFDLRWSASGAHLAVSRLNGAIEVWNAETGERHHASPSGRDGYSETVIDISPDGEWLAYAGKDSVVRIANLSTGTELLSYRGHRSMVLGLAFDASGLRLASTSADGTIRVWDLTRLQTHQMYSVGYGMPTELGISPDSRTVVNGHHQTIVSLDIPSGLPTTHARVPFPVRFEWPRGDCVLSPDATWLAIPCHTHLEFLDVRTGKPLRKVELGRAVRSASVDSQMRWLALATAPADTTFHEHTRTRFPVEVALFEQPTGRMVRKFNLPDHLRDMPTGVRFMTFDARGERLAAAFGGRLAIFNVDSGKLLHELDAGTLCGEMRFHPHGTQIAATDMRQSRLRIWQLPAARLLHNLPTLDAASSLDYSPSGNRLAVAGPTSSVHLWDPQAGLHVLTLRGQNLIGTEGTSPRVRFSRDGTTLVSKLQQPGGIAIWQTRAWPNRTSDPSEVRAWHAARLNTLFRDGQEFAAAFHLRRAVRPEILEPQLRALLLREKGRLLIEAGKFHEGIELLKSSRELLPDGLTDYTLGLAYVEQNDLASARPVLERARTAPMEFVLGHETPESARDLRIAAERLLVRMAISENDAAAFHQSAEVLAGLLNLDNPKEADELDILVAGPDHQLNIDWGALRRTLIDQGALHPVSLAVFALWEGNLDEALRLARLKRPGETEASPKEVQRKLVLAIVMHRLDRNDEARREFDEAGVLMKAVLENADGSPKTMTWSDRTQLSILRNKVTSLLK